MSHAEDIDKHVRTYLGVFGALMVLTVVTVAAWYFLELPVGPTIAVALFIAMIKASLVACYFMHLISEKKLILYVLILTVFFFFALLLLPVMTSVSDQVAS
jgi:cytochrome c oxidase subunit 4